MQVQKKQLQRILAEKLQISRRIKDNGRNKVDQMCFP